MRVRILKPAYKLEFDGAPSIWNDFLRPIVGGPEAPPDPVRLVQVAVAPGPVPAAPAAGSPPPMVRTFAPPELAPPPPAVFAAAPSGGDRPSVRTWYPPREARPERPSRDDGSFHGGGGGHGRNGDRDEQPWRRRGGPEPEIRIDPSNDPKELYERLLTLGSRRAEKDAVLAAVWFLGRDEREVHEREVDQHLREHGSFDDIKVRPAVAKHITRSKLLEAGTQPGMVRLSRKGREQIRLLCGV